MASTYSPQDAITLVQNFVHGVPVTAVQSNLCDMINSMIWIHYPWPWTIASLTPIPLVAGTQDYTPSNTDILRPLKMRTARTDITPNEFRELDLLANLAPDRTWTGGLDTLRAVGWYPSLNFFRYDVTVNIGVGQTMQLQGEYQKRPTKITDATLATPFVFPDQYFHVFVEGLKWKIYQLADDPRAGGLQKDNRGNVTATGQYGIFLAGLDVMARTEDLGAGDEFAFPSRSLGVKTHTLPGIFGLT